MTSQHGGVSRSTPEDNFRLLYEGMQQLKVGISVYGFDLRLIACNQSFCEIFDVPPDMVQVGAPLGPVIRLLAERGAYGKVDVDAFEQQALAALQTLEEPCNYQRCVADGRVYESQTSRLEGVGFVTSYTNITHHKESKARLLESQRVLSERTTELELILDNASLGILTVVPSDSESGKRVMRRVNRALEKLLGYEPGELEGLGTRILYPNDDEYDAVSVGYHEIVCSGHTYQREHVFARKDGSTLLGILRGSAIDPNDPSRGAIWLIEDITERKRIEAELAAKTALLQAGTDNMPGAMVIWDAQLRYIWWTPRADHFFKLPPGMLKIGLPMQEMARYFAERGDFGPGDVDQQIAMQMQPFFARESVLVERQLRDGRVMEVRRYPLPEGGFVSVFQDITGRKRMESELRQAKEDAEAVAKTLRRKQEQVTALLNNSGQGFLSFAADLIVDDEYSQACLSIFGSAPAGCNIAELLFPGSPEGQDSFRQLVARILNEPDVWERSFLLMQLPREFRRGNLYLEADFRMLKNSHLMVVLTDITDEQRFKTLSVTDRLTGLANRLKLDEELSYELERAQRAHSPLSAIIADIDHFKDVNDRHGHQVGDQVLIAIADILKEGVRKTDCVARWGGEEFMILCLDTCAAGARELAEKLRLAIAAHPFAVCRQNTCSFGVAEYRLGEAGEDLIRRADGALYRAKERGRNQVIVAT